MLWAHRQGGKDVGCRNVLKAARMAINKWFSPREAELARGKRGAVGARLWGALGRCSRRGAAIPAGCIPLGAAAQRFPRRKPQQLLHAWQSGS